MAPALAATPPPPAKSAAVVGNPPPASATAPAAAPDDLSVAEPSGRMNATVLAPFGVESPKAAPVTSPASPSFSSVAASEIGVQVRPPATPKTEGGRRSLRKEAPQSPKALCEQLVAEYSKLCQELRVPKNSGVIQVLSANDGETGNLVKVGVAKAERKSHEYDFSRLHLGDRQFVPLAAALVTDRHLVAVNVAGTGLMDNGMVALCETLKRNSTLECLDVSHTRFSIRGAEACLAFVRASPRLVLVRAADTCLDEELCDRRGLRSQYVALHKELKQVLFERVMGAVGPLAEEQHASVRPAVSRPSNP